MSSIPSSNSVSHRTALKEPPIYKSGRLMGHFHTMRESLLKLFVNTHENMGEIARVRLGPKYVYFTKNPEHIAEILTKQSSRFAKQTRGYEKLRLFLGEGLVTSEGDFWKKQRRIAQPAFHRERIAGFVDTMGRAAEEIFPTWDAATHQEKSFDISQQMMELTLKIAGETLFSQDISEKNSSFGPSLSYVLEHFNWLVSAKGPYPEYWPLPRNIRFWKDLRNLKSRAQKIIQQRRTDPGSYNDLLAMLMEAKDEETGESMSDKHLLDEVFTMLLAGHETTANALSWTFHLLSQHPDIAERVAQENAELLGERRPEAHELKSLTYTEQVFKEALRLYPPVWALARKATQETQLGDYLLPKGAFIFFAQYITQRDAQHWKDPEVFNPDRFAPEAFKEFKKKPNWRFIYFPFSRGQRQCIGDQFAMMEGLTVLSILSRKYTFKPDSTRVVEPEPTLTLRPKNGLFLHIGKR